MALASISQGFADTGKYTAENEEQRAKVKEDLLDADRRLLIIAAQKPLFSVMSSTEADALKKAKEDLAGQ